MKTGDKVHIVWADGVEEHAIFLREERGYIVVNTDGVIHACLPAHLKSIEVIDESR